MRQDVIKLYCRDKAVRKSFERRWKKADKRIISGIKEIKKLLSEMKIDLKKSNFAV